MYEHNALGYRSGLALCLTKVRSSRARCPATALITICTNLITNGTIGTEICANGKNGNAIGTMVQMLPTNGTIGRTPNTRSGILDIIVYY